MCFFPQKCKISSCLQSCCLPAIISVIKGLIPLCSLTTIMAVWFMQSTFISQHWNISAPTGQSSAERDLVNRWERQTTDGTDEERQMVQVFTDEPKMWGSSKTHNYQCLPAHKTYGTIFHRFFLSFLVLFKKNDLRVFTIQIEVAVCENLAGCSTHIKTFILLSLFKYLSFLYSGF